MARSDKPSRQRKVCKRKVAYFTEIEARGALDAVRKAGRLRDETADVYHCPICSDFHWGHRALAPTPAPKEKSQ
jgi:hypothetical protein